MEPPKKKARKLSGIYQQYTSNDLRNAIKACKTSSWSVNQASKHYHIPRKSLKNYLTASDEVLSKQYKKLDKKSISSIKKTTLNAIIVPRIINNGKKIIIINYSTHFIF